MLDFITFYVQQSAVSFIFFVSDFFRWFVPPTLYRWKSRIAKILASDYSTSYTIAMTWSPHLLVPAMQEHHALIIKPSGCYNPYFLFVMDTHGPLDTAKQCSFCTFIYFAYKHLPDKTTIERDAGYLTSDPDIYQYILCQIL